MRDFILIRSERKTLALQINDNCEIIVRAPYLYPKSKIVKFIEEHNNWIDNTIARKEKTSAKFDNLTDEETKILKEHLKEYLSGKIEYYSKLMNVKPKGYKVTSAKKRFGSCSGKNSLCFSFILMLYPEEAIDYVIVHELAHIRYHNHSKDFYDFVEHIMPDYKQRKQMLEKLE